MLPAPKLLVRRVYTLYHITRLNLCDRDRSAKYQIVTILPVGFFYPRALLAHPVCIVTLYLYKIIYAGLADIRYHVFF